MFFGGNRMNNNIDNNKYYKILGIDKNANEKDIKKAYRRLAVIHHPDKGGDPEKFKEVTKAFETLSDPNKRKNYDKFGEDGENMNGHPGDIFGQMFGMNKQNTRKSSGDNDRHQKRSAISIRRRVGNHEFRKSEKYGTGKILSEITKHVRRSHP